MKTETDVMLHIERTIEWLLDMPQDAQYIEAQIIEQLPKKVLQAFAEKTGGNIRDLAGDGRYFLFLHKEQLEKLNFFFPAELEFVLYSLPVRYVEVEE